MSKRPIHNFDKLRWKYGVGETKPAHSTEELGLAFVYNLYREIAGLLKKHMVDWPQGRLPSGLDSPVLRQLSVSSIPMHFVIGRDGRLVFAGRDFKEGKAAIASSFASEAKP